MTIENLYPKARPRSIYNVINGRPELPAASTISRASEATYTDANGIIRTAAVDEPRFNYDPVTGKFLGLLLEQGSTNIFTSTRSYASIWSNSIPSGATNNAGIAPDGSNTAFTTSVWDVNVNGQRNYSVSGTSGDYVYSIYVKSTGGQGKIFASLNGFYQGDCDGSSGVIYDFATDTLGQDYSRELYPNGWVRLWKVYTRGTNTTFLARTSNQNDLDILYWGAQLEEGSSPTSLIINPGAPPVTRSPDTFSLTSSSNFDGGFSLLIDSDTTTDDYFYKIKASGTTIAELNNANGTLDWVVNGESAATNGEYPQLGAIQPGRVRTVSSFGAADGTTQQNYLYTEGLSFPTNAIVASGADEVEFGPGQTLRAVYLWNGQLSNTEAVSVIKGEYNIISDEPIKADSCSFVYNTDPTSVGEATITLPYIVPTVSMRVYWGDTTNSAYEQGVTPSHTYPYPGQYRIQIEADDGFDQVKLADIDNTISRVDQWAPQHRVGAGGDGFTGEEIAGILNMQSYLDYIPPFKYADLTDLNSAFNSCAKLRISNWDWVPYELESCTDLGNAFYTCTQQAPDSSEALRLAFPQLQTSSALTSVAQVFANSDIKGWKDASGTLTNQPFTDSSQVTNWVNAFANNGITSLSVDTQSATNLQGAFAGNSWTTSPFFNAPNCTNFQFIFSNCKQMTAMNPSIANSTYSNGIDFTSSWQDCSALTSFPLIDTSSGTNFDQTFRDCTSLTSFPLIDTSSAVVLRYCWSGCSDLASFPLIETSNVTDLTGSWRFCSSLTSFPLIITSKVTNFSSCWWGCSITSFPLIDTSQGETFDYAWNGNDFTSFPALNFSKGKNFGTCWNSSANLADFPATMFDTTGTLNSSAFGSAWSGCALTAQSIENILVSLDTNGQSNIELGINGGTNAAKSTWTTAANTAYTNLIDKGWTITFNP